MDVMQYDRGGRKSVKLNVTVWICQPTTSFSYFLLTNITLPGKDKDVILMKKRTFSPLHVFQK